MMCSAVCSLQPYKNTPLTTEHIIRSISISLVNTSSNSVTLLKCEATRSLTSWAFSGMCQVFLRCADGHALKGVFSLSETFHLPSPHVYCPLQVGQKTSGFLHHNQICDVIIKKRDYDVKNLIMMWKARGLFVLFYYCIFASLMLHDDVTIKQIKKSPSY